MRDLSPITVKYIRPSVLRDGRHAHVHEHVLGTIGTVRFSVPPLNG
jgi:hypothetical protein